MRLNWIVVLLPCAVINTALVLTNTADTSSWLLAVLFSVALVCHVSYLLLCGVPDGWIVITLKDGCDLSKFLVPKGARMIGEHGTFEVTRNCGVPLWRRLCARVLNNDMAHQLRVPVRSVSSNPPDES